MIHANQIATRGRLEKATQIVTSGLIPLKRPVDQFAINLATTGRLGTGVKLASRGVVNVQAILIEEVPPTPDFEETPQGQAASAGDNYRFARPYEPRKYQKKIRVIVTVSGQTYEHVESVNAKAKVTLSNVVVEEDEDQKISIRLKDIKI